MIIQMTGAVFLVFASAIFLLGHYFGRLEERSKHLPKGSGGGVSGSGYDPTRSVPPLLKQP